MISLLNILYEIKIGNDYADCKNVDSYVAYWNGDTLYTLTEDQYIKKHTDEKLKPIYKNYNAINGILLVNNVNKTINLDVTIFSGEQNRRREGNIPILSGQVGIDKINDLIKCIKTLIMFDKRVIDYSIIGDDRIKDKTVSDLINKKQQVVSDIYDPKTKSLTFFNGTSLYRYETIKKSGLIPGKFDETYIDLIDGYSEKNIYLSFNAFTASNYATRQTIKDGGGDAVILKVILNSYQIQKLLPDEDSMGYLFNEINMPMINSLIKKFPILIDIFGSKEDFASKVNIKNMDNDIKRFNIHYGLDSNYSKEFRDKTKNALEKYGLQYDYDNYKNSKLYKIENDLYFTLLDMFIRTSFTKSVKKECNVAYSGIIKPNQINLFKSWDIGDKIHERDDYIHDEDYNNAIEKQKNTIKYY